MDTTVRPTAVAGAFYPGTREELERQLYSLVPEEVAHHELLACISPHAGYIYSGGVAGRLFAHLDVPRQVVVLGPNHGGIGEAVAVAPHESWSTPLGPQTVSRDLAEKLVDGFPAATFDSSAHWREHSIEVQLPFLYRRRPDVEILPVCIRHLGLDDCLALGRCLAGIISDTDEPVGIVASSDMSHYQPDDVARTLDHRAIDRALELDPAALFETVHREKISMCGVIPATVALAAANALGAVAAHLVAYATSGDVSGDYNAVVGYAGVCIHR
jgi:AmmeMemoRadiSam system protein B